MRGMLIVPVLRSQHPQLSRGHVHGCWGSGSGRSVDQLAPHRAVAGFVLVLVNRKVEEAH